ncbi:MAG: SPOR domain-containing protein [Rickettsiales bacterium]|jgi:cell division septation protein DedD|nr:SPOR domain-containing protein [Rickettsiales bacterium]
MAREEDFELLELDDEELSLPEIEEMEEVVADGRPRRPWLLFGLAALVIIIATYIIVRVVMSNSSDEIDIDLGMPDPSVQSTAEITEPVVETKPEPVSINPAPVRNVPDRAEAKFDEKKATAPAPVTKPDVPKAATKPASAKATAGKPATQPAQRAGVWYVQLGSYSQRSGAEAAQKKLVASHKSLLGDRQMVILSAVLPNGKTTYRLRVPGFTSQGEANGFCQNAKSDGLDCYVAK